MIIDFHTHFFPDAIASKTITLLEKKGNIKAQTDGTINGLLASMEDAGVDMSIVLPVVTKPSQFDTVNAFAKSVNEKYEGKLLSFGGIHPDCENYKEKLNRIKELGLPGIKIHPDYQGVEIDDVRYMNIIEYASELGLIILTHAGKDIGFPGQVNCPPEKMRKVLDKIKPQKMVLAHCGGWQQWEQVYEYLAGENVYLDTAFSFRTIETDVFLKLWEKHDKDKILFASDTPWSNVKQDLQCFMELPISQQAKRDILSENAKRLLGIK